MLKNSTNDCLNAIIKNFVSIIEEFYKDCIN